MPTQTDETRARLLRRLAVVADEQQTYAVRVAAARSIQPMLSETNPLRRETPEQLVDTAKPAWATRLFVEGGRGRERRVQRPPQSILDVW